MICLKINGKELSQLTMDEMADFFTQHIFFEFMDRGRTGLKDGVNDLIDTICQRSLDHTKDTASRARRNELFTAEFFKQMSNEYLMDITNSFVIQGNVGVRRSIISALVDNRFYP